MTLLDAYALVAFIAEEPAAAEVEALLRGPRSGVVVINLAEAVDICTRVHGLDLRAVGNALDPLLGEILEVLASTEEEAWEAARLRLTYYDRSSAALSIADCLVLAHAVLGGDAIATSDPALAGAARREDVDIHALPDSSGRRP